MNRKNLLILSFLFLIGFFLRTLYLKDSAITFFYDQARDAFLVKQIIGGDLKIQGLPANAPGLYHGIFYHYFLAIPYAVSNGSPVAAGYWMAFFSTAAIFIVYLISFYLFKNRNISLLASLFFVFSFEASQYAAWLSNPAMGLWFIPLVYLFLWLWTRKGNALQALLTGIFWGLAIQSDIFLVYHAVAIGLWLSICRKNVTKSMIAFVGGLFGGVSSILISQIKFGFTGTAGIVYLLTGGNTLLSGKGLGDFALMYMNQMGNLFSRNLLPSSLGFGGFVGLIMVLWLLLHWKKESKSRLNSGEAFLLLYIFSHLPVVFFGGNDSAYLTVGLGPAVCVLAGMFVYYLGKNSKTAAFGLLAAVLLSGTAKIVSENKNGQTIFALRREMNLANIKRVVDYTYRSSEGKEFSINSITAPLWLNTTWSYVYNWYGAGEYGYLPYWHGRSQIGDWGDSLSPPTKDTLIYYLIIEPRAGIPDRFVGEALGEEDSKSIVTEEVNIDGIVVQKRVPLK